MTEKITAIRSQGIDAVGAWSPTRSKQAKSGITSFESVLRERINDVDKLQHDAASAIEKAATGASDNLSDVMTAVEKADLAFRMLMQVRSKLVDAYEELTRMRI